MRYMSEKQFERFLVKHLKNWLEGRIKVGDRFQFRSTDSENTVQLLAALHEIADGSIEDGNTNLSYLNINGIQVLITKHTKNRDVSDQYFTDYYLTKLK